MPAWGTMHVVHVQAAVVAVLVVILVVEMIVVQNSNRK
jgi:hypothetical protein